MFLSQHRLAALVIFGIALVLFGRAAAPNVVVIIADNLTKTLAAYSYTLARTPIVDRLAARSVPFDRAYCQYPVCSLSQVSLLGGRRPEQTGNLDNL